MFEELALHPPSFLSPVWLSKILTFLVFCLYSPWEETDAWRLPPCTAANPTVQEAEERSAKTLHHLSYAYGPGWVILGI